MNTLETETRTVVVERKLAHPPEKVWRALTQGALMEEWLPQSGYTQRHDRLSFVEFYGPDFNAATGLGTMEIWVGLR